VARRRSRQRTLRKTDAEARTERLTWALLVAAFGIVQVMQQTETASLPNWFLPASGALVLLGSGVAQSARRWRVNPTTWIGGAVLLFLTLVNVYVDPTRSFFGISLVITVLVIVVGLLMNET